MKKINISRFVMVAAFLVLASSILIFDNVSDSEDSYADPTSGTCGDDLRWTYDVDSHTLTIEGTGAMTYSSVPWSSFMGSIKHLKLPDGLTTIGNNAFSGSGLTELEIPYGVTSIGQGAFTNCSSMRGDLVIPDSVTFIGANAFRNTGFTGHLTLSNNLTTIENYAFYNCRYFTGDLVLPNSLTRIESGVFYTCAGFSSLTLPDNLTYIGDYAFLYSEGFTGDLTIPEGVTYVGTFAFYDCQRLSGGKLTIPDSITHIGAQALNTFNGFSSVTVTLADGKTSSNLVLNGSLGNWNVPGDGGSVDVIVIDTDQSISLTNINANYAVGSKTLILTDRSTATTGGTLKNVNDEEITEASERAGRAYENNTATSFREISVQVLVTFDANGGTVTPTTKTVTYGARYGTLPTPTKTGYTFEGWLTERNSGTEVFSDTVVMNRSGHTLYAYWTASTYTVTFDANGGTVTPTTKVVTYAAGYERLPTPAKTGYNFDGWFTSATGGSAVTATTTVTSTADHTLYAHWTALTYTVTFDPNGGTPIPSNQTVTFDSAYGTLPVVTKTGFTFKGWYTAATGGTHVSDTTIVSTPANHTLVALWLLPSSSSHSIIVSFDSDGGSHVNDKTVKYGLAYGTLATPTKEGFTFDGWYFNGEMIISSSTVKTNFDHTLVAHWSPVTDIIEDETDDDSGDGDHGFNIRDHLSMIIAALGALLLLLFFLILIFLKRRKKDEDEA